MLTFETLTMHILKRYKSSICYVLFITLISQFVLNMSVANYVLCFGADGHVAVEHISQSSHLKSQKATDINDQLLLKNCSLPCVDIPLDGDDQNTQLIWPDFSKVHVDLGLPSVIWLFFLYWGFLQTLGRFFDYLRLSFIDSRLLAIRSIVLRN